MIYQEEDCIIEFTYTDYDDFLTPGKRTIKISKLIIDNNLKSFENFIKTHNIGFVSFEVKPSDLELKKKLSKLHFYYCNTTAKLFKSNLPSITYLLDLPVIIETKEYKDFTKVKSIIKQKFGWGRIYEDIFLNKFASRRMEFVLENLFHDEVTHLLIAKDRDDIVGYFIYKSVNNGVEAVFAGIDKNLHSQYNGLMCFLGFHKYLFEFNKYTFIKTSISLTNLAILNIYIQLGYSFIKVKEDFHYNYNFSIVHHF